MDVTIESIAAACGGAERTREGMRCLCPAHDDHEPSLDLTLRDGKILWVCRAGCTNADVLEALRANGAYPRPRGRPPSGATKKPKGPPPWERPFERVYQYHDAHGTVLGEKVRFTDGRKPKFGKRRGPDNWKAPGVEFPVYRLPETLAAVRDGRTILLCEGERDAESAVALGFAATTDLTDPARLVQMAGDSARYWRYPS